MQSLAGTRAGDPWMDVDSMFSGPIYVDSMRVDVQAPRPRHQGQHQHRHRHLLDAFLGYLLGDYPTATKLTAMIMDWRDLDYDRAAGGDEHDGYIKQGLLALPANQNFREVSDL